MRTLPSKVSTERAKDAAKPFNVLCIEWGGAVGTKYYSDAARSVTGWSVSAVVADWGSLDGRVTEGEAATVSDVRVRIYDASRTTLGYMRTVNLQAAKATLYQFFDDGSTLAPADGLTLFVGRVRSVEFDDSDAGISLDLVDDSRHKAGTVGTLATRENIVWSGSDAVVDPLHEGRMLPIIYGRVKAVPAVLVRSSPRTVLASHRPQNDDDFLVENARDFPSGTITLWIGDEQMTGSFSGNVFTAGTRGKTLKDSVTLDSYSLLNSCIVKVTDAALADADVPNYLGAWLTIDDGTSAADGQSRRIVAVQYQEWVAGSWTPSDPQLFLLEPFYDELGQSVDVNGKGYKIVTNQCEHYAGEPVTLVIDNDFRYVANAYESQAVLAVYARGQVVSTGDDNWIRARVQSNSDPEDYGARSSAAGLSQRHEGYVRVPETLYDVTLDDTTVISGETMTTIQFRRPLMDRDLPQWKFEGLEILVDLEGTVSGGSLVENPADVAQHLCHDVLGLTDVTDYDGSGMDTAAATAELSSLKCGCAITEQRDGLDVLADLAFQARSAVHWEAGIAKWAVLKNEDGTADVTMTASKHAIGSARLGHVERDSVVTEVNGRFTDDVTGREHTYAVKDATAESLWGRRVRVIDFWAYQNVQYVQFICDFWLQRWKSLWQTLQLDTFLKAIETERLDRFQLDDTGSGLTIFEDLLGADDIVGQVYEVRHTVGSAEGGAADNVHVGLLLPRTATCTSVCEMSCEQDGACETFSEVVDCATGCEVAGCQTGCETACENVCQNSCEVQNTVLPQLWNMSAIGALRTLKFKDEGGDWVAGLYKGVPLRAGGSGWEEGDEKQYFRIFGDPGWNKLLDAGDILTAIEVENEVSSARLWAWLPVWSAPA